MDLINYILLESKKREKMLARELVKETGFSRSYVGKILKQLVDDKRLFLSGKANRAHYSSTNPELSVKRVLKNKKLSEDEVFRSITKSDSQILEVKKNVFDIFQYSFLEILNNAIDHSKSKTIFVSVRNDGNNLSFEITDKGVGIFNNLVKKLDLANELDAVRHLLKGKQTTAPEYHSGEGIFFTSKVADTFVIESGRKKLVFDNQAEDVFIDDNEKSVRGTRVSFTLSVTNRKTLIEVFKQFTNTNHAFDKTQIVVELYKIGEDFLSRSQAKRLMMGLEKFNLVVLDFDKVDFVGQAFADEIFRVWLSFNPGIRIEYKNANENVTFMVKRALNVVV